MNSSKLKWILILMFLAVNIFFFHEYRSYSESIGYYTEEELENAVRVLRENNTPIKTNAIPKEKKTLDVLKLEIDDNYREKTANSLMKSKYAAFALPEGTGYSNSGETLVFLEGRRFRYTETGVEAPGNEIIEKLQKEPDPKAYRKYTSRLSEAFFPSAITDTQRMSFKLVGACEEDGLVYIRVHQLIDNIEVDGNEVVAVFRDNTLIRAEGNVFFSTSVSKFTSDMLDAVNLLFKTEKSDNEIVSLELLFFPVTTETGSFYLTPSYKLIHENGEVHVWDATSGIQRY